MLVALIAKDKAGALQTRLDNRSAHLEHVRSSGIVLYGGPLLDADGAMCGSLLILDVETMAAFSSAADSVVLSMALITSTLTPFRIIVSIC